MNKILILLFIFFASTVQADALQQLLSHETRNSLTTEVYEIEDFDSYYRELAYLRQPFAGPIPYYLAYPKDQKRWKGIVLMLHGITSSKDIWWQGSGPYHRLSEYRHELLDAGYVLVLPDSRFHGQRVHEANFESAKNMLQRQEWQTLRDLIAGSVQDFRLLLDNLQSDNKFKDLPVGVLGMSLGGIQTLALSAVDTRIEFLVPVFASVRSVSPLVEALAPIHVADKISAPCLLLISDQDVWYTLDDGKQLFANLSCKNKQLEVLSTPHELGYTKAAVVRQWIEANTPE